MPDLSDADPVAYVVNWLKQHPVTAATLGGPDHVSGLTESPWPHLAVSDGVNGDLRDLTWSAEFEVELELVGAPTGAPGQAALWRVGMQLLKALCAAPEEDDPTASDPVVSRVRPTGVFAWTPRAGGQPAYRIGVYVTIRPPLV